MTREELAAISRGIAPVIAEAVGDIDGRVQRLEKETPAQRLRALEERCARQASAIEAQQAIVKTLREAVTVLQNDLLAVRVTVGS